MMRVVGLGAGGHAKVLIDLLRLRGDVEIVGLTDPDPALWHTTVLDVPVLGDDHLLATLLSQGVRGAFIGVGGVGDNTPRQRLYGAARSMGFEIMTSIHPTAIIARSVVLESGVMIMAGAIINAGTHIDDNVIINTGAIVEHDCQISAHAHVAPGAVLSGGARVGEGAHIGAGAVVRQYLTIGARAIVGAGAVVTKDVPADTTVVGIPAKPLTRQDG
jgi:UDP-perosamine 4-acetyltransferase